MANSREYKTTVRFNAEELLLLRKAAGDTQLTRYVRLAALREARRQTAPADGKAAGDAFEGEGFHNPPPFGGGGKGSDE